MGVSAKFVGRWIATDGVMKTGYPGSSFSFHVSGATKIKISVNNATRIAYCVDNSAYKIVSFLPRDTFYICGLTISDHCIKVILCTSLKTYEGENCASVSNIEVDTGIIYPSKVSKRKIMVFGDSITEGYNASGQGISAPEKTWWNTVGDRLLTDIIPVGIGGIGYGVSSNGYPSVADSPSYIDNISKSLPVSDTDFDIIILELGTNDYKDEATIDPTYASLVKSAIDRIKVKYPSADIYAILPFNHSGWASLKKAYQDDSVSVIDTDWYSQITYADALHPDEQGHFRIADKVSQYFLSKYDTTYWGEPNMKRIDTIYLDKNGKINKIAGVSSQYPATPACPTGCIEVASVAVETDSETGSLNDTRAFLDENFIEPFFLGVFFNSDGAANGAGRIAQFYASRDGVNFTHINKSIELAEGGDPSIAYVKGKYYVAVSNQSGEDYDFEMHVSKDLMHWDDLYPSMGVYKSNSWGYCSRYAPDLFVDDDKSLYVVMAVENDTKGYFDVYISKCTDLDTLTFEVGKKLTLWDGTDTTNLSTDRSHIDATIYKKDDTYYMAVKNEAKATIEIFTSTSLYTGWKKITSSVYGDYLEGPCIFWDGDKWLFWADRFTSKGTYGVTNYVYAESDDLITFRNYRTLTHDNNTHKHFLRHGTVRYITDSYEKKVITNLHDFKIKTGVLPFTPGGASTDGSWVQILHNADGLHEDFFIEPFCKYKIHDQNDTCRIGTLHNYFNVQQTSFSFLTSYTKMLIVEKSDNGSGSIMTLNYKYSPAGKDLSIIFTAAYNGILIPLQSPISPNFMVSNDLTATGYIELFSVTLSENYSTFSTIFQLLDCQNNRYDALYHVSVYKDGNGTISVTAKMMDNFVTNVHELYAVVVSNVVYFYADCTYQSQSFSLGFLTAHQKGNVKYMELASTNHVETDLSTLGTVTKIVSAS